MTSILLVRNHQRTCCVNVSLLRQISRNLLRDVFAQREVELAVHLVGRKEITRLNETFLRHKGGTDVIAFDYRDEPESETLCGEIVICVEEALVQARRFRTCWQNEVIRYLVHGLLHLAGYDDRHPRARQKMKRVEDRLLKEVAGRFTLSQIGKTAKTKVETRRPKAERRPKPEGRKRKAET